MRATRKREKSRRRCRGARRRCLRLRQRASVLLENTTFLPRLPDCVHAGTENDDNRKRKQSDVIVQPHRTACGLCKRITYVGSLCRICGPLDLYEGVLVLQEKGVPKGSMLWPGARQHLLNELFAGPVSGGEEEQISPTGDNASATLPAVEGKRWQGRIGD